LDWSIEVTEDEEEDVSRTW